MSSPVRSAIGWLLPFAWLLACGAVDETAEIPTASAKMERIERIVVATGTIEPEREVEVRSRIAGIVEKIHVEDGDRVEPGQPLVEIERELLEAQVREAAAALEAVRVELRFAKIALERSLELERSGAASQQKRDDARSRQQGARAEVARAQARLDNLNTQLSYATVRSPLAGRVLQIHTEEGNAVSPVTAVTGGIVLLSLAGTEALYLEGLVDENEIARVAVGQRARVQTEAFPERSFEGSVRTIAPMGQRIQNVTYFEVKIEIVDPDAELLLPRMSGDADIITETVESALVIPETALRYRGANLYVEIDGPAPEERRIEIGIVDGSRVQVLSGLAEGETVRLK
ncbi:MAG: efflux RND transporter periplasmic adaptor subunit [bacterium]|nr:efflux RND transporter periplasmic adaptor subunit [bacterium]MDP7299088.1 efflux RND transporter periplasmic adaptor subunit [Myxococcota bacterium]HJO23127.1 efflux RND transporter periplasmic adaptor subunit [Myxococcota bacterium]